MLCAARTVQYSFFFLPIDSTAIYCRTIYGQKKTTIVLQYIAVRSMGTRVQLVYMAGCNLWQMLFVLVIQCTLSNLNHPNIVFCSKAAFIAPINILPKKLKVTTSVASNSRFNSSSTGKSSSSLFASALPHPALTITWCVLCSSYHSIFTFSPLNQKHGTIFFFECHVSHSSNSQIISPQ